MRKFIGWGDGELPVKSFKELKSSKPFYPSDIIIYCIVAVFTGVLFLAALFAPNRYAAQGFDIYYNDIPVAEYAFSGGLTVKNGYERHFDRTDEGVYFYPNADDRSEYNLIVFDSEKKTAKIARTTCTGRECASLTVCETGGFIYCAPHKLKILPAAITDPVTG